MLIYELLFPADTLPRVLQNSLVSWSCCERLEEQFRSMSFQRQQHCGTSPLMRLHKPRPVLSHIGDRIRIGGHRDNASLVTLTRLGGVYRHDTNRDIFRFLLHAVAANPGVLEEATGGWSWNTLIQGVPDTFANCFFSLLPVGAGTATRRYQELARFTP